MPDTDLEAQSEESGGHPPKKVWFSRRKRLFVIIITTSLMFLVEIFVGYWTRSIALITDSFHMLSDLLALIIAWYAITLSSKKKSSSEQHTYGWQRAETLGALVNTTFLWALCFTILISALERFLNPVPLVNPFFVFIIGWCGLGVNLLGLLLIHDHSHGSHSHAEGALNMKGVFLHVMGDALGSVGVIVTATIVQWTNFSLKVYMDPAASVLIAIIIIATATPILRKSITILMHIVPKEISVQQLKESILGLDEVKALHEFHVWQLSEQKTVATVHVVVQLERQDLFKGMSVVSQIKDLLHSHGIHNTTVQLEITPSEENNNNEDLQEPECISKCIKDDCEIQSCCD